MWFPLSGCLKKQENYHARWHITAVTEFNDIYYVGLNVHMKFSAFKKTTKTQLKFNKKNPKINQIALIN